MALVEKEFVVKNGIDIKNSVFKINGTSGAAHTIPSQNTAGTGIEWKTLDAGNGIKLTKSAGSIIIETLGTLPANVTAIGNLTVGVNATWSGTGTTTTITYVNHGLSNSNSVTIYFTSGANKPSDAIYTVSNVTPDTFDVTHVSSGGVGSGNATVGGTLEVLRNGNFGGTVTSTGLIVTGTPSITAQTIGNAASVFNTTTGAVNIAGASTSITLGAATGTATIRNASVVLDGDLQVKGGDITTNQASFNLLNTTPTAITFGDAAATLTIGATTGTATLRNANTNVSGILGVNGGSITSDDATFTLLNTTPTSITFGDAAATLTIGATTGTATIRNASVVLDGDLQVKGGDITTNQASFNLLNTTPTAITFADAAATLTIGATTGTATLRNANVVLDGDLQVKGGDITTNQASFNLLNTTPTSITFGDAAATLTIGATTGTATIRNANTNISGALGVNGGSITSDDATFALLNTTPTAITFADAAATLTIGATTGTATIRNASVVLDGDLQVKGGDITSNQSSFALLNAAPVATINFGGAASTLNIGANASATTFGGTISHKGLVLTNGTDNAIGIDQLYAFTTGSLSLTSSWVDSGISTAQLVDGVYLVRVQAGTNEYYTGVMPWADVTGNASVVDTETEIVLSKIGDGGTATLVFMRILRTSSAAPKIQLAGSTNLGAYAYVFNFRRMI